MAHRTLDERFSGGPPKRSKEDTHGWLNAEERRFILWAFKERWSAAKIGRALGVNEATARRFRQSIWRNPRLMLELQLFERVPSSAKAPKYRCLVCSELIDGGRAAEDHVIEHFVDRGE